MKSLKGLGDEIDIDHAIFFGNRDLATRRPFAPRLPGWQLSLFAFLYRNAVKMFDRFNLPPEHVLEISREIEI
jgi:KUP system potassium uptake protein